MPDDIFRIIVAVGVVLAAMAFVVQAIVGIATLRAAKAMQTHILSLTEHAEPVIDRAGPVMEKVGPMIEKLGPALDSVAAAAAKFGPISDKTTALIAATHQVLDETRPKLSEISTEALEVVRTGRQQVERIGDLLTDASDRARNRLSKARSGRSNRLART